MIELPLIFVAGLLGAAHCLGMCGPLAIAMGGAAASWRVALMRQAAYTAGRAFTYAVLGVAAGYLGARMGALAPMLINAPALLAIGAGAALIYFGLKSGGWWPRRAAARPSPGAASCMAGSFLRPFFTQRGTSGAFLGGLFTGLLPCGLLYGMIALAAAKGNLLMSGATMAVFALGTGLPLAVAGLSGRLLGLAARRKLTAIAAICLIVTGAISVARGAVHLSFDDRPPAGCPFCEPAQQAT